MTDELAKPPAPPDKKGHFSWGPFTLTLIADGMIAWCIYMVFFVHVPDSNQRVADILVGNVVVAWVAARSYWYSTTYGSQQKDKVIAQSPPVEVK